MGSTYRKQQGLATVLVSVVLMLGLAIITLYANRVSIFDLKSSSNQVQSSLAFQAAEYGLEQTIANIQVQSWRTANFSTATGSNITLANTANNSFGTSQSFAATITRLSVGDNSLLRIDSRGCSDACSPCANSCTNTATVSQVLMFKSALSGKPSAPMTAKGSISTGGNADIINLDPDTSGITVHSGSGNVQTGSATLHSLPGTPPEASVAKNDTTLTSLTDEQFFQEFFGDTKANVQASSVIVNPSNANKELDGMTGKKIWIPGDTQINSNITVGSMTEPVIIIVDGELKINGTVTIYGILYCTSIAWDNTGMGNVNIYGAAVAEGSFSGTGTPTITYTPTVTKKLNTELGEYVKVIGSWRDF